MINNEGALSSYDKHLAQTMLWRARPCVSTRWRLVPTLRFSILIPCLDEAENVAAVDEEVIGTDQLEHRFTGDGSTDTSLDQVRFAGRPRSPGGARLLHPQLRLLGRVSPRPPADAHRLVPAARAGFDAVSGSQDRAPAGG